MPGKTLRVPVSIGIDRRISKGIIRRYLSFRCNPEYLTSKRF